MTEHSIKLNSIQIGQPTCQPAPASVESFSSSNETWMTAFYKETVNGRVGVRLLGLEGDGQADRVHHGGIDKAVCVYSADHFPYWRNELSLPDFGAGAFGENFTVSGIVEADVCIGDIWRLGTVDLQVSQPRQPCWKLARRWNKKDLALRVQNNGFTGWYFRVLSEGDVEAGMAMKLQERSRPEWTVERANQIMHHDIANHDDAAEPASLSALSESWQTTLIERIEKQQAKNNAARLHGEDE